MFGSLLKMIFRVFILVLVLFLGFVVLSEEMDPWSAALLMGILFVIGIFTIAVLTKVDLGNRGDATKAKKTRPFPNYQKPQMPDIKDYAGDVITRLNAK